LGSLLISRITSAALQAVTLVLMARSIPIELFGLYSTGAAIGAIAMGVLGFGLATRALRLTPHDSEILVGPIIVVTLVTSLVVGATVLLTGIVSGAGFAWWLVAAALLSTSEMMNNVIQNVLFGEKKIRRAETLLIVRRAVPLAAIAPACLVAPDFIFQAATIGFLVSVPLALALIGKRPWEGAHLKSVLGGSKHYWTANISSMAQQFDLVIVTAILGPASSGAYAAAFRLASPIHIVTSSLVSILVPQLTHATHYSDRAIAGRKFMLAGCAYALLVALAAPLGGWLAPIVLGSQYVPYRLVFAILLINSAISIINQLFAARLYGENQQRIVSRMMMGSTATALLAVAAASWMNSVDGAAAGLALGQIVLLVMYSVLWSRRKG